MDASIARAEVLPYALAFKETYASARGALEQRELVLLRLRSSEGAVGLGEAVPLSLRGGLSLEAVAAELRDWAEAPRGLGEGLSAPARCAIETALLDLEARTAGVPLWRLLGAEAAKPVECNATLGAGAPLHVAQRARDWAAAGFRTFKLKAGVIDDVAQASMVRRTLGPQAQLRVDANGAWEPAEAFEHLRAMNREAQLQLAEQPCASLEDLAVLRKRIELPICADESVTGPEDGRAAVAAEACDMATVKLSKVGGIRAALRTAEVLPVYMSSALDGPVGIAAAAHAVQALPPAGDAGLAHGLATQRLFSNTVAAVECDLRDGFLHLPPGPGLGVEIDDGALERHRL